MMRLRSGELCVSFAVVHGIDAMNVLRTVCPARDVLQTELRVVALLGRHSANAYKEAGGQD